MKHLAVFLFMCMACSIWANEKVYVPSEDLVISPEGIFLRSNHSLVPMGSISYDYEMKGFYLVGPEVIHFSL